MCSRRVLASHFKYVDILPDGEYHTGVFRQLLTSWLDLIFPPLCILCKKPLRAAEHTEQLCLVCQSAVIKNRPPFCRRCSRPLKDPHRPLCKTCRKTSMRFDQAWGCCVYGHELRRLIHLLKYGHKTALRRFFSRVMLEFISTYHLQIAQTDYIIPVPLHPARLRERGFNQAQLIAELLAEALDLPLCTDGLYRARYTVNQARVTPKERWTNIHGAFKINPSWMFTEKNILLVDDLLTTGATGSQAAQTLKNAGANRVIMLTLGITPE